MKLFLVLGLPFLTRWEEPHPVRHDESVIMRRWVYPSADEGTDKALYNEAVVAEQSGDLDRALELSREAYVKNPRRRGIYYIESLEERIADRLSLADLEL